MTQPPITIAQTNPTVGDIAGNTQQIIQIIKQHAKPSLADHWIIFPEMALTGYPVDDLLQDPTFQKTVQTHLQEITQHVQTQTVILGCPTWNHQTCQNSALVLHKQHIVFAHHKTKLADYGPFYESRNFNAGQQLRHFTHQNQKIGLLICEEIWHDNIINHPVYHNLDILITINASPFSEHKIQKRTLKLQQIQQKLNCPIIYTNMIGGQDELIFDGHSMLIDAKKTQLLPGFKTLHCHSTLVQQQWKLNCTYPTQSSAENLYDACTLGLHNYLSKNNFQHAVIAVSGGIDSALVLAMASECLPAQNIHALIMPSRHNSKRATQDAITLCRNLNIQHTLQSIEPMYHTFLNTLHLEDTGHITTQNLQARIRGTLLMLSANQKNALAIATSNKSELAMGYTTLYGDACGGYAPLKDLYKTQIYLISQLPNRQTKHIPSSIINAAPSAELAPQQTDQDTLPPYKTIDAATHAYLSHRTSDNCTISKQIQNMEYKRRQMAIGPIVSEQSFGKDWLFPITNHHQKGN